MRQLILLRHAEAQSQGAGIPDFDRALTGQGRTEALDAAECLKRAAIRLDGFLVSPAVRARETALIVAAQLDFNQELLYDETLYHGDAMALLSRLQRCDARAVSVLLVGHNPSVSELVRYLAAGRPVGSQQRSCSPSDDGATEAAATSVAAPPELTTAGLYRLRLQAESWSRLSPASITTVTLLR
jgi:phosphohistidine phosphatase